MGLWQIVITGNPQKEVTTESPGSQARSDHRLWKPEDIYWHVEKNKYPVEKILTSKNKGEDLGTYRFRALWHKLKSPWDRYEQADHDVSQGVGYSTEGRGRA